MRKIKISHECPVCLLPESKNFNDYEYCLVHLLEENKQYKDYYFEAKKEGRYILLDNSLFELGEAFDSEKFLYWINALQPDEYIIPDVPNNADQTIANLETWNKDFLPRIKHKSKRICVLQGETYEDLVKCYKYAEINADKIAINFLSACYKKWFPNANDTNRAHFGRHVLLYLLTYNEIINFNKPHHLLGCTNPIEFVNYNRFPFNTYIESIDTSSPIVHTILGIEYPKDFRGWEKKNIKLADLINTPIEQINKTILEKNIKIFRDLLI